ncbi:chemotaxis protein CheD [Clostridioides difficile]|nr:chemotaxis protein CheD [Clostridioides difficile]EGT4223416.1 chemotaxis protein CheD [Clostridioides difficile]
MNREIVVDIADMKIAYRPNVLVTYALGSCVGVCLIDKVAGIGGMLHVMLPYSKDAINIENKCKFADTGINELIKSMENIGANRIYIKAKIAGGAQMFLGSSNSVIASIGHRNVEAVKKTLLGLNIPILAEDTGMNYGRTIRFYTETGELLVDSINKGKKKL